MPYYIYRITQLGPVKQLEKLADYPSFKEASARAKEMRNEIDPARARIQVVFGENELQAEDAINTVRQPEPFTAADL
jgi:hypothetical protein